MMLFWERLKPRQRKVLRWAFGLVLLYAVVGFLILPPMVRHVAARQLARRLGRDVSIGQVKINPFALSATVRGLLIKERDGAPFVSWDELYVNLQLSSFLGHAWVFKEISLSKPFVHVQMNDDSTFNFTDIIARLATNAPVAAPKPPSPPVRLQVERLHIGGASVAVADFTPREPFKRFVGPIDITLNNFGTDPANKNPYSLTGTTDAGETILASGVFSVDPLRSEGELKLFHFALTKYATLYQDLVRFRVLDGSVSLSLKYRVGFDATNRVAAVEDFNYSLRDFKLGASDGTNAIVEVPIFSILGASADLPGRVATVNSVAWDGARAWVNRDTNAAINVVELARPAPATNAPGGILLLLRSVTNAVAMLLDSTNQWTGSVRRITATNCALHLEDHANARPARLDLSEITLQAKNLSNLPGTNLTADFSLRWNTNAAIHLAAAVGFQPTTADVQLDLDRLDLTTLDAYLAGKVKVLIPRSEVNLHGAVRVHPPVNGLPVVSFQGDASLEHFLIVDEVFGGDLVKWNALRFNGITANLNPPIVALHDVLLDGICARVVVETNHTLNVMNVLPLPGAASKGANETDALATISTKTTNNTPASAPMQLAIGAVSLTNTTIDFSDRSTEPNVNLALQNVNGSVSGFSTTPVQPAVVTLNAKVDGAGPVLITGILHPRDGTQTNDLSIVVQDVDLTPTSPYAGKFAGYGIAKGKLNLDLKYQLAGKMLAAKNVITLDQFTFGEKVNSPEATHLPVRLAVAIMKDRDGKIVLDVPVEGNLDDPKFHLGKVITRVVVNLLEKVATSPFSLLGALVGGGGEELGWQGFALGSTELTPEDEKKLDALAKALYARPALTLEISGSVDPEGDREGLQRAALDRQLRTRQWNKLSQSESATNSVEQLTLTPAERASGLAELLDQAVAAKIITPEFIAAHTNLAAYAAEVLAPPPEAKKGGEMLIFRPPAAGAAPESGSISGSKLVPPPDPVEAVLLATIPVSDAELATLAAGRARAVQTYLLQTGKVEAGRVFLTARGAGDVRRDGSRTYLQFR